MHVRKLASVAVGLVMVLGLAACGDDGDDDGTALGGRDGGADIVIDEQGFKPNRLTISRGEEVTFSVRNDDNRPHSFTLTFLEIDQDIAPDQRVDIKLKADEVPPAGFYSFYSDEHQSEGYQGQIRVTG